MTRKLFVFTLILVMLTSSSALGVMRIDTSRGIPRGSLNPSRTLPSDPRLPNYDNPTELDLDGPLHISFKGVFRQLNEQKQPTDYIAFVFVATPQNDMRLGVDRSELYDGSGTRFNPDEIWIGRERTSEREIIGGIPMRICVWFRVPPEESDLLPTVARVNITFNGKSSQYRNIVTEDASIWEGLAEELRLNKSLLRP